LAKRGFWDQKGSPQLVEKQPPSYKEKITFFRPWANNGAVPKKKIKRLGESPRFKQSPGLFYSPKGIVAKPDFISAQ